MPPHYGIDPVTGVFTRKPIEAIRSDIAKYQRENIDPTLDVTNPGNVLGNINESAISQLDLAWEQLETIAAQGMDPDAATTHLLEMLSNLTATNRRGASKGTVPLDCNLDQGTVLTAGTHYAAILNKADVRWTPVVDYTALTSGVQSVLFEAEKPGPIAAVHDSITVIATPVVGWKSVNNPEDATLGRPIDDDPTLRARRSNELGRTGSSTVKAIEAQLLLCDERIISVTVLENDTDVQDPVTFMPPHSVQAIVNDGPTHPVPNDLIAQTLLDTKSSSITAVGNTFGDALVDDIGTKKVVRFSRPVDRNVYLSISITKGPKYPGDAAVAAYLAARCSVSFGLGAAVIASRIEALLPSPKTLLRSPAYAALGAPLGIMDVSALTLGFFPLPAGTANLPIGSADYPRFDSSRIVITSS